MRLADLTEKQFKVVVSSAVILLVILVVALMVNLIGYASLNATKRNLERELDQLATMSQQLDEQIAYYNTDHFVEQFARENLNMIYQGELFFV